MADGTTARESAIVLKYTNPELDQLRDPPVFRFQAWAESGERIPCLVLLSDVVRDAERLGGGATPPLDHLRLHMPRFARACLEKYDAGEPPLVEVRPDIMPLPPAPDGLMSRA